jgi:hypothetical protein
MVAGVFIPISGQPQLPRQLRNSDGRGYLVGGTDTLILARRMLAAAAVVHAHLPYGFDPPSPLQIMMQLYVAEEEACYLTLTDVSRSDPASQPVTKRWLAALESNGFVERRDTIFALTTFGYERVIATLEALFAAQRRLD